MPVEIIEHDDPERGITMRVVDGGRALAYAEVVCPGQDWEEIAEADLAGIAPWMPALRILLGTAHSRGVPQLLAELDRVSDLDQHLRSRDADEGLWDKLTEDYATELESLALPTELDAATRPSGGRIYTDLATRIAARLHADVRRTRIVALGSAPYPPSGHPIGERWELPHEEEFQPRQPLGKWVARNLLEAYKAVGDARSDLIQHAIGAGLTKTEMHERSGLARTTINNLLAGED